MKGGGLMHARMSKRSALLLAVLAAVLAVTGGAAAGPSTVATKRPANPLRTLVPKLLNKNSQQREQLLHRLAAKEGEVDVYTSLSTLITGPVQKAWAARYPDVKLDALPRLERGRLGALPVRVGTPARRAPTSSKRTARRCSSSRT